MYEIIIGKAIGSIKIGMKREEVQNLFNDLNEWRETPFGYDHEVVYDNNDEFQICYDENNCVNFILCNVEDSLSLNGKVLNDELFYEDILEIAKESASDVEEDEVGFTSNQLGFGACAYYDDDDEDEVARIESVQVAVRNFWKVL